MCGINGIIFKTSKTDVSKILKMNALLDHRGPDDSGFINHKNLLLGHTRLSIIDTSNLGSQPMSVDGRYWIIYNGEIYNYKTLREELILKKYKFYSNSDTEVVLNAYKEWGVDSFQKFNGEWSFAILDKKHNEIIICRDYETFLTIKGDNGYYDIFELFDESYNSNIENEKSIMSEEKENNKLYGTDEYNENHWVPRKDFGPSDPNIHLLLLKKN